MSILWDNIFNFDGIPIIRIAYMYIFNSKYGKILLTNIHKHVIMCLRKLKTMCLTGRILQLNSVTKQVITKLSGCVLKSYLFY